MKIKNRHAKGKKKQQRQNDVGYCYPSGCVSRNVNPDFNNREDDLPDEAEGNKMAEQSAMFIGVAEQWLNNNPAYL